MLGLFRGSSQGNRKMHYQQIADGVAVSGQIHESDLQALADAGFKSVVCNRPDAEMGAVPHNAIAEAARALGLEFRYIPVGGPGTQNAVGDMVAALNEMPQPMLAYCRSGARSANLYMVAAERAR